MNKQTGKADSANESIQKSATCRTSLWLWIFVLSFVSLLVVSLLLIIFVFSKDRKYTVAETVSYMVGALSILATTFLGAVSVLQTQKAHYMSEKVLKISADSLAAENFCILKVCDDEKYTMTQEARKDLFARSADEEATMFEKTPAGLLGVPPCEKDVLSTKFKNWEMSKQREYQRFECNQYIVFYLKNVGRGTIRSAKVTKLNLYHYERDVKDKELCFSLDDVSQFPGSFIMSGEEAKLRAKLIRSEKFSDFSGTKMFLWMDVEVEIKTIIGDSFVESCELFGVIESVPVYAATNILVFSWLTASNKYSMLQQTNCK
ncbi:MAG: hypothetical protein LBM78_01685 [Clostridiales bacterium]|nr:hypothetical protein [Clostridiales bacterium]